jgi:hypothetical protein
MFIASSLFGAHCDHKPSSHGPGLWKVTFLLFPTPHLEPGEFTLSIPSSPQPTIEQLLVRA